MNLARLGERLRRLGIDRTSAALGALTLLVYAPAASWGIPHATSDVTARGWDVDGVAGLGVLSEFHNLVVEAKPDWYTAYPLFHYLLLGALYAPYLLWLMLTGGLSNPTGQYPFGFADPVASLAAMSWIARGLTLAMAAGTVMAAYRIGETLWDRRAGVVGAVLVLLSGPLVFYGRTSNLDVPVIFWTAVALAVAARASVEGLTVRRAVLLGAFAGIAVATKDQAYGALAPALVVVLWRHLRGDPGGGRVRAAAALVVSGAVVFAVAGGVVFAPGRFASHLSYVTGFESNFFNVRHPSMLTVLRPRTPEGFAALTGDAAEATVAALAPVIAVLGLFGAVLAWRRRPESRFLAVAALGFLVLTLFPVRHMQYRYAMLPSFVLALFAAHLVADCASQGGFRRGAAWTLLLVGGGWEAGRAADLTWQMLRDARHEAGEFLAREARPGDRVAYWGVHHQLPHVPAGVAAVRLDENGENALLPDPATTRFVVVAPDYFSDEARERSVFLPEDIYRRLVGGSLGYRRVAAFSTPPLLGSPLPYLPYVNPQVQVFERGTE